MSEEKFEINESLSEFLGIGKEYESEDEFRATFEKEFIRKSLAPDPERIKGETFGKMRTAFTQLFREMGIDITKSEWEGDALEVAKDKILGYRESLNEKIKELEQRAEEPGKELEILQEKLNKREQKLKDIETLHKQTLSEFDEYKSQSIQKEKSWKINTVMDSIRKDIPWSSDRAEQDEVYFNHKWNEKYKVDLDDDGKPVLLNKEGERIPNPKTTGTFLDPKEAALSLATELGQVKKTDNPNEVNRGNQTQQNGSHTTGGSNSYSQAKPFIPVRRG